MPRDVDGPGVSIANSHAALHAARLTDSRSVTLPAAPFGHLFVVRGTVELPGSERLAEGDAVRLTDHGEIPVAATGDAEILFWEMHTSFGRT
ncbi:Putative quercetin 2,3-dioxygenase [Gordonia insulae]|uniref:Quercetin 2,3-dioxygenase n=1 Tax=Gordonia insulae TaxID=2420509 RepID=A0A3G8JJ06_9ACTN|nr:Putative quercetin 2,3-dioxygenase [Gordonia insulae]